MSILTRDEILKEIDAGRIKIEPCSDNQIGPGSVDLHLGEKFRVFHPTRDVVEVNGSVDYKQLTDLVHKPDGIILMPGETILGMTVEKLTLPENICGWLEGRSRFARIGLLVHISAGFMQPGISNHQLLEMSNFSPNPLRITPGTKVCQFIFQRTEGTARYDGRFQDQTDEDF
jgi:dCTP deaminase